MPLLPSAALLLALGACTAAERAPVVPPPAAASPRPVGMQTYTPGGAIGEQPPPAAPRAESRPPARTEPPAGPPPVRRGSSGPPPPPWPSQPTLTPPPTPPDIRGQLDAFTRDLEQPAIDRLQHERALGRLDPIQERDLMMRQQQLDSLTRGPAGP